ncbi:MAG: hypothetical protein J3K34DRAFT_400766 [Monoraphidium minutum]|nr:MAG: hypothetical protein J3K34DRAFT_400766 [Monoraphidium minutum]
MARCAGVRLECLGRAAPEEQADSSAARRAGPYVAANSVDAWEGCPVQQPRFWTHQGFARGAYGEFGGLASAALGAPIASALGAPCAAPLRRALLSCGGDHNRFADPAATVTSLATLDGCCLSECAARLKEAVDQGCAQQLVALTCNASLAPQPEARLTSAVAGPCPMLTGRLPLTSAFWPTTTAPTCLTRSRAAPAMKPHAHRRRAAARRGARMRRRAGRSWKRGSKSKSARTPSKAAAAAARKPPAARRDAGAPPPDVPPPCWRGDPSVPTDFFRGLRACRPRPPRCQGCDLGRSAPK